MDGSAVIQLISNMGFPVAMCLILAYYIKTEQDTMRETLNELKIAIHSLTDEIRDMQRKASERGDYYDDV